MDSDKVPSKCDEEAKLVIKRKNKKIKLTKKLLKGKEAKTKNLRQELRDMRKRKRETREMRQRKDYLK